MAASEDRAKAYHMLGSLYMHRPDVKLADSLYSGEQYGLISVMQRFSGERAVREGLGLIGDFVDSTRKKERETVIQSLAVDFTRLFRGLTPAYSPPPPYESVYREGMLMGRSTQEVARIYSATSFSPETHELPDYLGLELGYMDFLCEKTAESEPRGDRQGASMSLGAQHSFLNNHLAVWVPKFIDLLLQRSRLDFYRGLGKITLGYITLERERLEKLRGT